MGTREKAGLFTEVPRRKGNLKRCWVQSVSPNSHPEELTSSASKLDNLEMDTTKSIQRRWVGGRESYSQIKSETKHQSVPKWTQLPMPSK